MSNYLLTVIVPTKDRQEYAAYMIGELQRSLSDKVEIVVADNSADASLGDRLAKDARVVYENEPKPLSFSDNFNRALGLAHGEYVIFIGDDDLVLPAIEAVVEAASRHDVDAVLPSQNPPSYIWRDRDNPDSELLTVPSFEKKAVKLDTKREVQDYLHSGCLDYLAFDLAKVYHGIVRMDLLESLIDKSGACFGELSPDIYSAIAVSAFASNAIKLLFPLTIAGVCPSSGSGESMKGKHEGRLSDAPHLRNVKNYQWDERVPPFYCVETIWADSALHACKDFGLDSASFNKEALWARCSYVHRLLFNEACAGSANRLKLTGYCVADVWRRFARKTKRYREHKSPFLKAGVGDLGTAREILEGLLGISDAEAAAIVSELFE